MEKERKTANDEESSYGGDTKEHVKKAYRWMNIEIKNRRQIKRLMKERKCR